ncbi:MAG: 2-C-methyl-D-erythritol 4-phosphate cytidylyltransferase [Lachnospiraceae bacterium]|nr:2-C-methyl-D-erythritol 4-phosphate cytidylyltransferase [Lachnospiraceae bacterium]
MIYGVILAGGIGSRMGNVEKPKQYLMVGSKPIIIHTIEKFCVHDKFEKLFVLSPRAWMETTKSMIRQYLGNQAERIVVLEGGDTRNETIMNSIRYIEETDGLDEDTLIVTHDSVRPFLTYRIIEENIKYGLEYGAADTVIRATDTIVYSKDGSFIGDVPNRANMYQGQTPQTFNAKKLKEFYYSLSEEEKKILTDASKIFVLKGEQVYLVEGEVFNIKITYPYDLQVANAFLGNEAALESKSRG